MPPMREQEHDRTRLMCVKRAAYCETINTASVGSADAAPDLATSQQIYYFCSVIWAGQNLCIRIAREAKRIDCPFRSNGERYCDAARARARVSSARRNTCTEHIARCVSSRREKCRVAGAQQKWQVIETEENSRPHIATLCTELERSF